MQTVIETEDYLRDARYLGLSHDELQDIALYIAEHPRAGELMVGTGGARKVRFAGRGKGKSGGYRIITFFGGEDIPVFLLTMLSKGEKANLTKAERNELRQELAGLAADYRRSVMEKVVRLKPKR